jgi:hypothetical protein
MMGLTARAPRAMARRSSWTRKGSLRLWPQLWLIHSLLWQDVLRRNAPSSIPSRSQSVPGWRQCSNQRKAERMQRILQSSYAEASWSHACWDFSWSVCLTSRLAPLDSELTGRSTGMTVIVGVRSWPGRRSSVKHIRYASKSWFHL